jgi:hypothetical protein
VHRLLVLLVIVFVAVPAGVSLPANAAVAPPGVEGRVSADGTAVAGASIEAIRAGAVVAATTTAGNGTYELALPEAGTYDLRVTPTASAGLTATVVSAVVVGVSVATVVDVQLRSPLGTLEVTVLDGSGAAVEGALVSLRGAGFTVTSATANASGVARLVTKAGTYGLRIEPPSPPGPGAVLPAGTRVDTAPGSVEVTVAGASVTAQVPTTTLTVTTTRQSDGTTVPGVLVSASTTGAPVSLGGGLTGTARFSTAALATDGAGQATLRVLAVAGVSVSAEPASVDPFLAAGTSTTDVDPSGTAAIVELAPTPVQPVTVLVLDANDQPVSGATVRSTLESASTDGSGAATVRARSDVGTELRVTAFSADPAVPEVVTFRRNVRPASPLALVARARVATLTVQVTRESNGTPIAGAKVGLGAPTVVVDGWAVQSPVGSKSTGATGEAVFRVYPAPGYSVSASATDVLTGVVDVDVADGSSTVPLALVAVGPSASVLRTTVTGRVVTSEGLPIGGLQVRSASTGSLVATTTATGTFSFGAPVGPDPQSLRFQSANLLTSPNRFNSPFPVAMQVVIPGVFTAATTDTVALGDIVIPLDTLEVRVVDQVGGGLNGIRLGAEARGSRFPVTVGGNVIEARGTSDYPVVAGSPTILTEIPGEATLHLLPGNYEIRLVQDFSFWEVTLPIEAFARVDLGTDDIVQISVTRPNAALLSTLDGTPKISDEPFVLEGPRPRLIPIVALPDGFQDGSVATQATTDWVFCGTDDGIDLVEGDDACEGEFEGRVEFEFDEAECPTDCDRFPEFPSYPVDVRVYFRSGVSNPDGSLASEAWRSQVVTILPPVDRPPTIAIDEEFEYLEGPEGSVVTFSATATDDTDEVEISWDLDGDGIGDVAGPTLLFDLPDGPDFGAVTVIATDSSGQSTTAEVYWSAENVAPDGRIETSAPDADGVVTVEVVEITDPSAADIAAGITVELDLDGDGTYETSGSSGTVDTTGFADGQYPVGARLTDKDRGQRTIVGSYTVGAALNGAPTIDVGGPYTVGEGGSTILEASADDPDGDPVTITWSIPGTGERTGQPGHVRRR